MTSTSSSRALPGFVACAFGCRAPMQPVPDADAWRCPNCGAIAWRDQGAGAEVPTVDDVVRLSLLALHGAAALTRDMLVRSDGAPMGATAEIKRSDVVSIEAALTFAIGHLSGELLTQFGEAIHANAMEAAARCCDGRAESLLADSAAPAAALEATKCAFAIRRLVPRSALDSRPDLTRSIPHQEALCRS